MVVEETIIRDCPIKQTLKYARVKSIIAMKLYAQKLANSLPSDHKFKYLANILLNKENVNLLLRMAVNRGDSIMHKRNNNESMEQIGN